MKRPSQETLDRIGNGTIWDFLVANDILAIESILRNYFHTTGYG